MENYHQMYASAMVFLAKEMIFKDNNYGKKESKFSITIFEHMDYH